MTALEILKNTRRRLGAHNWSRGWGSSWRSTCLVGGMRLSAAGLDDVVMSHGSTDKIRVGTNAEYREALIQMALARGYRYPRERVEQLPTDRLEHALVGFNDSVETSLPDVQALLTSAIDALEEHEAKAEKLERKAIPQHKGDRKVVTPAEESIR